MVNSGVLSIESSGEFCSVALSTTPNGIFSSTNYMLNSQSGLLGNLISNLLISSEMNISELKAIAIGSGPGSYTGLRIGLSLAKGLCFSNDIPLVAVDSMQNIACQVFDENAHVDLVIVALDARRSEIYVAVLNKELRYLHHTCAIVLGENICLDLLLSNKKVAIAGDGALKTLKFYAGKQDWIIVPNKFAHAETLLKLSSEKIKNADFESLESFEPNYIKPVFISIPK